VVDFFREVGALRRYTIILVLAAGISIGCGRPRQEAAAPDHAAQADPKAAPGTPDGRPVIVALGDSLTAGLGVGPSDNYPARLQAKLDSAGYRYRVVNEGISGDTSAQGLSRLGAVRALHPAVVIVELGANDGLRGLPLVETRRNLEAIVRQLQQDGSKVVLAGMEMPPNYGAEYTRGFREIFRSLAARYHVALIPFFLAGVGGRPELNQDDGIHPTAKGYEIVVENVWTVLKPTL
jgi:acyl-CoA thioesterase-1